jgi:hypothetical protein
MSVFCTIYLDYDRAFDWSPDDPRLYELADRTQQWLVKGRGKLEGGEWSVQDPALAQLVSTSVGASSPAWDRLTEIGKRKARA